MNVSGLNNLGFTKPAAPTAPGKAAPAKDKASTSTTSTSSSSSFDSALTHAQSEKPRESRDDKQRDPQKKKEPEQKQAPETKAQSTAPQHPAQSTAPAVSAHAVQPEASRPVDLAKPVREDQPVEGKTAPVEAAGQSEAGAKEDVQVDSVASEGVPTPSGNFPGMGASPAGLNGGVLNAPVNPNAQTKAPNGAVTPDDSTSSLTRRAVWNEFLRKMNGLGVSVEDMMQAFNSLNDKELAMPPEQTVDRVVMALGLNDAQAQQARQFLSELVSKTKSKSLGEELSASSKQIDLTLMSQREVERKKLTKAIDVLERNFFREPTAEQQAQGLRARDLRMAEEEKSNRQSIIAQAGALESPEQGLSSPEGVGALAAAKFGIESALAAPAAPALAAPTAAAATTSSTPALNALMQRINDGAAVTPDDRQAMSDAVKSFARQQAAAPGAARAASTGAFPAVSAAAGGSGAAASAAPAAASAPRDGMAALNSLLFGEGRGKDSAGEDSSSQDEGTGATLMNAAPLGGEKMAGALNKTEFQNQLAQSLNTTPAAAPTMAVPELVQNAQLMVRDGGGEMKVTLHPEGLGEVAMRVSVDGGKVQVQMITESDEAKRLIERSLSDLKTGLTQNHLQVDSIKVDTATNLGKQLEQQYHEAQRQAVQANMEQFRQDTQGWRRSFFDTAAVRPYSSQGEAPRDVSKSNSSTSTRSTGGSRRLDLVA